MTIEEAQEYLKDFNGGPENIRVGDSIDGMRIVEIKNMVNGKPTYASTFVVESK